MSSQPPGQPVVSQMPAPLQPMPPPMRPVDSRILFAIVAVVVAVAVVLAVVVVIVTRPSSPPVGTTPTVHEIGLSLQSTGSNWSMLVSHVSGTMLLSGTIISIFDHNGAVKMPMSAVPLSSLTQANWGTYHVVYQSLSGGSTIKVGDRILVYKPSYPSGNGYQISESSGILATGHFQ